MRFYIPGTKNKKTSVLQTRDELTACKQSIEMYQAFKNNTPEIKQKSIPTLHECIDKFLYFKRNPGKNRKPISLTTINNYELHLTHLEYALSKKNIDSGIAKITAIDNNIAEIVFQYIKKLIPSSTTQKNYFTTYKSFCNYVIDEEGIRINNPFNGWHFDKPERINEVIYEKEFNDLLKAIKTKPKTQKDSTGKERNMYYDWLSDGFKLGLYTGARRQEVAAVKWSDIVPNRATGLLMGGFVLLSDIKSTNIQKLSETKIKPIEINEDLEEFLHDIGYNEKKDSNEYIVGFGFDRAFVKDILSRSFAYYIKFASKRQLTFGCLRKTWFTSLAIAVGNENASFMGGHSTKDVTVNHYINKMETAGTRGKFKRVFQSPKTEGDFGGR